MIRPWISRRSAGADAAKHLVLFGDAVGEKALHPSSEGRDGIRQLSYELEQVTTHLGGRRVAFVRILCERTHHDAIELPRIPRVRPGWRHDRLSAYRVDRLRCARAIEQTASRRELVEDDAQ
jgi:hypothetical protein